MSRRVPPFGVDVLSSEDLAFLAHLDRKAERGEYAATATTAAALIRRLVGEAEKAYALGFSRMDAIADDEAAQRTYHEEYWSQVAEEERKDR